VPKSYKYKDRYISRDRWEVPVCPDLNKLEKDSCTCRPTSTKDVKRYFAHFMMRRGLYPQTKFFRIRRKEHHFLIEFFPDRPQKLGPVEYTCCEKRCQSRSDVGSLYCLPHHNRHLQRGFKRKDPPEYPSVVSLRNKYFGQLNVVFECVVDQALRIRDSVHCRARYIASLEG